MGARIIQHSRLDEQFRRHRDLKKRLRKGGAMPCVTIVQDERTKQVLGVGVDREAAARFRDRLGESGDHAELIDFAIEG